ncbi:hypothetical protein ABH926_008569 [Catenulispora sp. GP43]|uniref:hypothetical protein n=1 Tax=Catenulispora sp. GP43 TaxID=3156263 RepID=UPI0035165CBF
MQSSDEIRAATEILKRQAAAVRQAFRTPAPEGLTNDEILAWERAGEAAYQEWKLQLARILFEMYAPDDDPRLSCCCGGYHVVARHRYPEDGEREILVGPCQAEEEIEARVAAAGL